MHKIIANNFELDLSNVDITITEENSMFLDQYITKYSFPFSFDLSDEIKKYFEDIIDHRSKENTLEIPVVYVLGNIREAGVLYVDTLNTGVNLILKYGIEEFPNFSKKLAELGLQKVVTTDIYAHAKTIIPQTWPDVNYNFPQIHTDKIDTSDPMWQYFEKIYNNYKDGEFVINEVLEEEPHNRNLMLPVPYWLHILTQGFADAGYTLKGDVLNIEELKKKVMYADSDYHKVVDQVDIDQIVLGEDKVSSSGNQASFLTVVALPEKARYRVTGTAYISGRWKENTYIKLSYRGNTIWLASKREKKHHSGYLYSYDVNVIFDTINDSLPDELIIESSQYNNDEAIICDINISSMYIYNEFGVAIPNVVNNNTIDLSRVVPDKTFGSVVTVIKNWYNLDTELRGKEIWMNFIDSNINYDGAVDLSEFKTIPERTYNKGISFVLKFIEASEEKNNHQEVYYTADGFQTTGFVRDDKTIEIEIGAFPFKNEFRNGVQTAYAIESEKEKIYALLYSGLNDDALNLTDDPTPILLPDISQTFFSSWLNFRVNAINYKHTFYSYIESIKDLSSKSKIFNFGRYFIIKSLVKRQVKKDLYEVEIDQYTLK
ncbi:hypothetical protein [Flavobacterium denitrificans]|uniref:hypothetical protein n=1 Tax=Flavobacterium denitrificans TaxID=281361 RepID=UPI0004037361|nr:hypothetical protein [Flavobacterium denitrificans]